MIPGVTDSLKYVYHYRRVETAIEHILPLGRLRLGRYNCTNDPKEVKDWSFSIGSNEGRDLDGREWDELSKWFSSELKSKTRVLCFSRDEGGLTGNHLFDICKRGFCKPRMWAQYGGNHTGVCLVFNKKRLLDNFISQYSDRFLLISGDVDYVDRTIADDLILDQQYLINLDALELLGRSGYPEAHIRKHYKRLFFEKMKDWQAENEWRCVLFAKSDEELYLDYKDSLVGVIFGNDTSGESIAEVKRLSYGRGLAYQAVRWKNCAPWYDFADPLFYAGSI
ncbi:DUF2971 domain-containing protein [Pseudomonas citronellolis]|uniref:DUF2971 domain-containing protein n=1 Tax=Pseudomonas citronellolis TaxID=53408 RepID=UPI0021C18A0D|nr:DUF2971 domain-containing protein [Pseudomonas citronellolis]UXJ55049.1 DUF2971 domain-containing protein [Pseudomonas citronellolis]